MPFSPSKDRGVKLTGVERAKSRIISSGLGDTAAKNPFLLSKAEERAARKKQMELRDGLTIPRRYVQPSPSCLSLFC
jgi:hypothetical protein